MYNCCCAKKGEKVESYKMPNETPQKRNKGEDFLKRNKFNRLKTDIT